ncbi:hypothetical protein GCM10010994_44470 [Chelatococcus reniformis]|uniref:Major facilitator superfamily (MFS) profile domain-containing protein n=1 Tax=Chelatococcus reniformis TaxID=1494448 RepID=A0A916UPH4_9HYPH|nr:hypothetical protein GCM10010994_44470 [Chelatococcus reniformis]
MPGDTYGSAEIAAATPETFTMTHTYDAIADKTAASGAADKPTKEGRTSGYAWYALAVLFLVYCLNFIDRQILSILAEHVKKDLGLTDQDLGFLYGTAFGIFYALFGIPLGRLADHWRRVRLLSIGLGLWSAMTALSGTAQNGAILALARIGVGVGEATASPCAYSLISDWFPAGRRATALAIYSAGLFVGAGLSLFIGGLIVENWDAAFPVGGPLGLVGWRVAFLAVGLPGVILAFWVLTLREPLREQAAQAAGATVSKSPLKILLEDLSAILPPLTLADAARRGPGALAVNIGMMGMITFAVFLMTRAGEPLMQWAAIGCGVYAVASWAISLRSRDRNTFSLVVANPAMAFTIISYGLNSFLAYSVLFWTAPFAIRVLGTDPSTAGLFVGGTGAAAGFLGVTVDGFVSDRLLRWSPRGRLLVVIFGAIAPAPFVLLAFSSSSLLGLCAATFLAGAFAATALGAAGATVQDIALPRMRGTAIAAFTIGTTLLGLALGPYMVGRISTVTGDLAFAMKCLTLVSPIAAAAGILAYRFLPAAIVQRDAIFAEARQHVRASH